MGRNNRQKLLSMVRGESGRVPLWRIDFGENPPREPEFIDEDEVEKLFGDDHTEGDRVEYQLLFGCPDEDRERVLRENPCLVRQPDGRFVAVNPEKTGQVYLIE